MARKAVLALTGIGMILVSGCARESAIKHVTVYGETGMYCGWPADNGAWSWGNEIVVGFTLGYFKDMGELHSMDTERPSKSIFARSVDGGETWNPDMPVSEVKGSTAAAKGKAASGYQGNINFKHPDFVMICRMEGASRGFSRFHVSYDRGKSWSEPYALPGFDQLCIAARSEYIVNSKDDCQMFLTACKTNGKEGRPFCARTTDGGKTFKFVSWIGPEPGDGYAIMPSTVRVTDNRLVSAIRIYERGDIKRGSIHIYRSDDNGQTWEFLCKAADAGENGGNPPSMIMLRDGRLCLTYGFRSDPYGIRAMLSSDDGRTWSRVIVLRQDGRNWELGYPRTVQRADGKVVTMYYYSTRENPYQRIEATIWDPDKVLD